MSYSSSFHFILFHFISCFILFHHSIPYHFISFHIYLFLKYQVSCHNEKKKNQVMIITLLWGFCVILMSFYSTIGLLAFSNKPIAIRWKLTSNWQIWFLSFGDHFFYTECGGGGGEDGTRKGMSQKTLLWNVSIFTWPAKCSDNFVIEFPPLILNCPTVTSRCGSAIMEIGSIKVKSRQKSRKIHSTNIRSKKNGFNPYPHCL